MCRLRGEMWLTESSTRVLCREQEDRICPMRLACLLSSALSKSTEHKCLCWTRAACPGWPRAGGSSQLAVHLAQSDVKPVLAQQAGGRGRASTADGEACQGGSRSGTASQRRGQLPEIHHGRAGVHCNRPQKHCAPHAQPKPKPGRRNILRCMQNLTLPVPELWQHVRGFTCWWPRRGAQSVQLATGV